MWLTSLCATNQALHDANLDLGQAGVTLNQEIKVPMNETYRLRLILETKAKNPASADVQKVWNEILCPKGASDGADKATTDDEKKSPTFSLTLEIKTLQGQQVSKTRYVPSCPRPASEDGRTLNLGVVDIKKGRYVTSITNEQPISIPNSQRLLILLSGTNAGFP